MRHLTLSLCGILFLTACSSITSKTMAEDSTNSRTAKINAQLGIAYLEQKELARAKKKLLLALKQDPSIPEPWYSMAYFMESTGNNEDADIFYQKAVRISHHRGDAENNYGTFLCRIGKYQEAVNHFLIATKDQEYLTPADAYENAGVCASKIAGENHAVDYFNRAISYDQERPVSWMGLAEQNFKQGHYQLAHKDIKRFLALSPPTERSMALNTKIAEKLKVFA